MPSTDHRDRDSLERTLEPDNGSGFRRSLRRFRTELILALLVASFLLTSLWHEVVVPIHSGEQGVYWSRFFGGTLDIRAQDGTQLKLPWDDVIIYNIRRQAVAQTTTLLSVDGMMIEVRWYVRYEPISEQLPYLHRHYGPHYVDNLITPEVVSSLREVLGNYRAHNIFAEDEKGLLDQITHRVHGRLRDRPVRILAVKLLQLKLPDRMHEAIVVKLIEEQRKLSYVFRLDSEHAEAERKSIEAQGLQDFERISGISALKWRGIKATVELAQSPNTKIVLMGTDSKQLPIILNAEPTPAMAPPGALTQHVEQVKPPTESAEPEVTAQPEPISDDAIPQPADNPVPTPPP